MKTLRTFKIGLLLSSLLIVPFAQATPDTVPLAAAVSATGSTTVLDRTTGDLYIGTGAVNATTNITKITAHNTDGTTPTSAGVASTMLTNKAIRLMVPSYNPTTNAIRLVVAEDTTNTTKICIQSADGLLDETTAAALKDANGDNIVASGVRAIAANDSAIFAAVADGTTNWADTNRGINVIAIDSQTTLAVDGAENAVAVLATANTTGQRHGFTNTATLTANQDPVLHWDDTLSRLYIGAQLTTGAVAGDGAVSVLCARSSNADGNLTIDPSVGDTAAFAASTLGVIFTRTADTTANVVKAYNLGVMHTSTGFSYLIVNGGSAAAAADLRNVVYAQPLVTRNGTTAVDGTFAKHDLNSPDFSIQAVAAGDLCTLGTEAAQVGGSAAGGATALPLPFTAATLTRMQVIGDCVYVASSVATDDGTIEAGIFYSTPEFNENGKIIRWSRWTRVAPAELGTSATDGDVQSFAVDPRNGKIWTIVGDDLDKVNVSTWGEEGAANELASAVNAVLTEGCTAIGVFDRTTVNWGNNVGPRMSLFGGKEKVVFTVQSRTDADPAGNYSVVESPVGATANGATNFLSTTLPADSGYVTAIGGTNYGTTAKAFFFLAGTTEGLYAYANTADGEGATLDYATAENLHNLDGTIFTGASFFVNANSWQPITNITGHIKKIETVDTLTLVLARDTQTDGTIRDTLWSLRTVGDDTVAELITNADKIAESGVSATSSDLTNATEIFDFAIINGNTGGTNLQVVLATNNGLYQSKIAGGIQQDATTQTLALWTPVGQKTGNTSTDGLMYTKLFQGRKTNLSTSFQAIGLKDNSSNTRTYAYRGLEQFACSDDDNGATGNEIRRHPSTTNYLNSNSFTSFLRLNRILNYWSDGARRFFITSPADGSGTTGLYIWPYRVDSANWNITDPVTKVSASALSDKTLYCCNFLPDGHFAVGTDTGIVVL